ncbi:MAG TPA: hypothetical protein VGM53_11545 [Streptosporangiaceae bacterium]|jgi:hypothetical protein
MSREPTSVVSDLSYLEGPRWHPPPGTALTGPATGAAWPARLLAAGFRLVRGRGILAVRVARSRLRRR